MVRLPKTKPAAESQVRGACGDTAPTEQIGRYGHNFVGVAADRVTRLHWLLRNLTIADDRRRNFHVLGTSRTRVQLDLGQMYRIDAMHATGQNDSTVARALGVSRYQIGRYLKKASTFLADEITAVNSQDRQIYHYVRKRMSTGVDHDQILRELADAVSLWYRVSDCDWGVFDRPFVPRGFDPGSWGL